MNTVEEKKRDDIKLDKFINAVYSEADKKSNKIIENARRSSEEILSKLDNEARSEAQRYIDETKKKLEIKTFKSVSKVELDGKKTILLRREQLTDKIFQNVFTRLNEFKKTDGYLEYLIRVITEYKPQNEIKICLMPSDMKYADEMKSRINVSCEITADKSIQLGGVSFYFENDSYVIDKTFDSVFSEQKQIFHDKNYFGEVLSDLQAD